MNVESLFLKFSVEKLNQFTDRIEFCVEKLTENQIWARGGENENAAGNLIVHLAGNVRQWIVSSLGNNPVPRDRDAEFNARGGHTAAELIELLRATVAEAVQIIANLDAAALTREYEIQNYRVSGVEAVYHVVEHFGEHTGQIIFITKMLTGSDLGFYAHLKNPARTEQAP